MRKESRDKKPAKGNKGMNAESEGTLPTVADAERSDHPKGTTLTGLDKLVLLADGEPVWQLKATVAGDLVIERDANGIPMDPDKVPQVKLTRRRAVLQALSKDPPVEGNGIDLKMLAGRLQDDFFKSDSVSLDAKELEFLKARVCYRFNSSVLYTMVKWFEGVTE